MTMIQRCTVSALSGLSVCVLLILPSHAPGPIMPGSQWLAALLPPLLLLAALCQGSRLPGNPQADPKSIVVSASGTVRFTVLADGLLRIEYSATRSFNDRQTMVVWNRRTPVPAFSASTDPTTNTTQIATARLARCGWSSGR
jgi:hypothetical protein